MPLLDGHLVYSSRQHFLRRCGQMCIALTSVKNAALEYGDLSGRVLHPVLVPIATLIGFVAWQEATAEYDAAREDIYCAAANTALEMLLQQEGVLATELSTVHVQAHGWLSFYYFWRSRLLLGFRHLRKAITAVARLGITELIFSNSVGRPRHGPFQLLPYHEAKDNREESIAAFCQLLYFDCDSSIMLASTHDSLLLNDGVDQFLTLRVPFCLLENTSQLLI